jgi:hypothetical protein
VTGFEPGRSVVLQEVWRGKVWAARPMRVARDDRELVALWFPRGTRWRAPIDDPARDWNGDRAERLAECAVRSEWLHRELEWDVDTLSLMRRETWHALWVSWLPSGKHLGWYVNLQEPFRRSAIGFEMLDLALDLIIDADGTWRWKDEDELETFVARGVFEPVLPARLRAEALGVVAAAERGEGPFGEPWPEWRPDPAWRLPELRVGWDRLWR